MTVVENSVPIIGAKPVEMFPVSFNMPQQRVWDLLCTGMEAGAYSSFRYHSHEVVVEAGTSQEAAEKSIRYGHIDPPFHGGCIVVVDKYQEAEAIEDGEEVIFYKIDREALQRGLKVMGEKYPHLMAQFVNDNEDAPMADAFLQCALLGDSLYG